jgi:hypothetical protein
MVATNLALLGTFLCEKTPSPLFSVGRALCHLTRHPIDFCDCPSELVWSMDGVVLFAGAATPFYTRTLTSRCCDGDKYRAIWFRRLSCGGDTARRNKTKCGLIVFHTNSFRRASSSSSSQQGVSRMTDRSYSSGLSQSTQSRLEFSIFIRTHNNVDDIQGQRLI